ncbi:hypothetical protein PFISCL1PPCAC_21545, partial [Pristionchus fissidentatus]
MEFNRSLDTRQALMAINRKLLSTYGDVKMKNDLELAPVLKLSFSHVVLGHIANLGKLIMSNLIDHNGSMQQVLTHLKEGKLVPNLAYSSIGIIAAPMVVLPCSDKFIELVADYDPLQAMQRFRLRNIFTGAEATAKFAMNKPNFKKPASIAPSKLNVVLCDGLGQQFVAGFNTSLHNKDDQSFDEPGPSKRIKVEEEEEEI